MAKIYDMAEYLDDGLTWCSMLDPEGNAHVFPMEMISDIVNGELDLDDVEDKNVIRAILLDWLCEWQQESAS